MRKYHGIVSLLVAFHVFDPPDASFQRRTRARALLIILQVTLSIGIAVNLKCLSNMTSADTSSAVASVILTLIFVTIPLELYVLVWFNVVISRKELGTSDGGAKYCNCFRRLSGVLIGIAIGLGCLTVGLILFIQAFVDTFPYCSRKEINDTMWSIILAQFGIAELYMVLPYWREQSKVL